MARRRSLRSEMYRTARVMGDIEAAEKGPSADGTRVLRKNMDRRSNAVTRKPRRMVGLTR